LKVQRFRPKLAVGLSFSALAVLYSLMLVGVYITASHQRLSCPGWPLCPNGFGPPSENEFFEYYHRLMVVFAAGLIYITTGYSIKHKLAARKTAVTAATMVSVQITLGMFVVSTQLEPLIVASHLSAGMLLFAMVLMTFLSSYGQATKAGKDSG
jgi:heme A synthase